MVRAPLPSEIPHATEIPSVVYVQLNSGDVETVSPATSCEVQRDLVLVYNGPALVATYPRKDVFGCSRSPVCPALT